MAELLAATLSHGFSGTNVLFTVNTTIRFAAHELGVLWGISLIFSEDDAWPNPDDEIRRTGTAVNFRAVTSVQEVSINIPISKTEVNTEWGDEEIFVSVVVFPVTAPPPFVTATGRTNKTIVDV